MTGPSPDTIEALGKLGTNVLLVGLLALGGYAAYQIGDKLGDRIGAASARSATASERSATAMEELATIAKEESEIMSKQAKLVKTQTEAWDRLTVAIKENQVHLRRIAELCAEERK